MKAKIKQWLKYKAFKTEYIKHLKDHYNIEVIKLKSGLYEVKYLNIKAKISNKDIKRLLKVGMTPLDASHSTIRALQIKNDILICNDMFEAVNELYKTK